MLAWFKSLNLLLLIEGTRTFHRRITKPIYCRWDIGVRLYSCTRSIRQLCNSGLFLFLFLIFVTPQAQSYTYTTLITYGSYFHFLSMWDELLWHLQHVLKREKPEERSQIVHKLSGHVAQLSQHKFASNVIEKCLEYGDSTARGILIEEIVGLGDNSENLLVTTLFYSFFPLCCFWISYYQTKPDRYYFDGVGDGERPIRELCDPEGSSNMYGRPTRSAAWSYKDSSQFIEEIYLRKTYCHSLWTTLWRRCAYLSLIYLSLEKCGLFCRSRSITLVLLNFVNCRSWGIRFITGYWNRKTKKS